MIHDPERVEAIRQTASKGLENLDRIEQQVKDPGFRELLRLPRNFLGDVETLFLSRLGKEARTAQEEARWLSQTELYLSMATVHLKQVQDLFDRYGPNIETRG